MVYSPLPHGFEAGTDCTRVKERKADGIQHFFWYIVQYNTETKLRKAPPYPVIKNKNPINC